MLNKFAEFPVTMSDDAPLIPAQVNGTAVQFVADSGAFYSMISPGAAHQLGLKLSSLPFEIRVSGIGGDIDASSTTVHELGLSKSTVPDVEFIVGGGEVEAPAIGLIGQNVLGLGDVEYDFADGVMRLFRTHGCGRTAMVYWADGKPFSVIDIESTAFGRDHTIGTASVNGHTVRAMFDTGAGSSVLSLAAARRAGLSTDGPGVVFAGYSRGLGRQQFKTWIAPVESFKLGDEEIKHTRLRIGEVGSDDVDMLIGADFFLSHRVYVANGQNKLYFTYNGGPVFDLRVAQRATLQAPTSAVLAVASPAAAAPDGAQPKDAEDFSRRGAALVDRGRPLAAIDDFSQAISLAPQEPRYLVQRAQARIAAGQPFLAMADLDAALKLKPDDVAARLTRAAMRARGRDRQGALDDLDAASAALPPTADQRLSIGTDDLELDALGPAVKEFDQWIAFHGDDSRLPAALNGRCRARALGGQDLDKALADCSRAVRSAADPVRPLETRGLVYLRLGDYARAIADDDAALKLDPKLAWSLYGRGVAELKSGDQAKGQADLAAAAAIAPHLAERAAKLGVSP